MPRHMKNEKKCLKLFFNLFTARLFGISMLPEMHKILFRWNQIASVIQSDLFPSTAGNKSKLLYLVL